MPRSRTLTGSGITLPELGLGCATLAFDAARDALKHARAMLADATDAVVTYSDTAPFYGRGLSECLVGDAVSGKDVVMSSKVGCLLLPNGAASTHMPL
ncbi:MAG: aldo/keto reductase [Sulfitobacter sp.]